MNKYRILTYIMIAEFVLIGLIGDKISTESWLVTQIVLIIILSPLEYLLYSLSKEEKYSEFKRMLFKYSFWLILFLYVISAIVELFD